MAMTVLAIGERIMPPKPEPHRAADTARPRLRLNQLVTTTEMNRRTPEVISVPEIAASA